MIRGYRKQASWAQAGELAAVAELAARRSNEALAAGARDGLAADAATAEIAAALTLTGRAAQLLTGRAIEITGLPLTFAALADGQIDMPKTLVLLTGLAGQEPELARTIEAEVIDRAAAQTTGQLRASLNRALLAADPAAADRRRQREEKFARVEQTPEPGGLTAALTGRYLPVTASVAAWNRISDLARQLKTAGADGHLDELRVQVYLALLTGQAMNVAGGARSGDALTSKDVQASRDVGTSVDAAHQRTATRALRPPRRWTKEHRGTPAHRKAPAHQRTATRVQRPQDRWAAAPQGTSACRQTVNSAPRPPQRWMVPPQRLVSQGPRLAGPRSRAGPARSMAPAGPTERARMGMGMGMETVRRRRYRPVWVGWGGWLVSVGWSGSPVWAGRRA